MEAQYFPPPSQLFFPPVAATVAKLYDALARSASVSEQLAVCHKLHGAIAKICASRSSSALRSCLLFAVSAFIVTSPKNVSVHTAFKRITLRLRSALQRLAPASSDQVLSTAPAEPLDAGSPAFASRPPQPQETALPSTTQQAAKTFFDVAFQRQPDQKELRPGQEPTPGTFVEYLSHLLAIRPFVQDILHDDLQRVGAALNLVLDPSCSNKLVPRHLSVAVNVVAQLWDIALEFTGHYSPKTPDATVVLRAQLAQCGKLAVRVIEGTSDVSASRSISTLRRAYWLLGLCAFGLRGGRSTLTAVSENVAQCVEKHACALDDALASTSASCCAEHEGNWRCSGGGAWSNLAESHRVALLAALVDAPLHVRNNFCCTSTMKLYSDGSDTPAYMLGPFLRLLLQEYTLVARARGPANSTAACCLSALHAILVRFLAQGAPALGQMAWLQFQRSAFRTGKVLLTQLSTSHSNWSRTHEVFRAVVATLRCRGELELLGLLVAELDQLAKDTRSFFMVADSLLFHRGKPCRPTSSKFLQHFPSFFKEAMLAMANVSDLRGAAIALIRKLYIHPFVAASTDTVNATTWIGDAADVLEFAADSGNEALANLLLGKVITNADVKVAVVLLAHLASRNQESDARTWAVLQLLKTKPLLPVCGVILPRAGQMATSLDVLCAHNTSMRSARGDQEVAKANPNVGAASQFIISDTEQLMNTPGMVHILAAAVAKSTFSANAWILEAVLQLLLLCFEQTHLVSMPLLTRAFASILPFEANGAIRVARDILKCGTSSAKPKQTPCRIDVAKLVYSIVDALSPSAPFDQLNNGFLLIRTVFCTESSILQMLSAEALLAQLVRQCVGAMLHCSFSSVVASARVVLNCLTKNTKARQLLLSPAVLRVVLEYKAIAAVVIFSLHAEYCGAVALLNSIPCVQPTKPTFDFSDLAAVTESIRQLARLPTITQIEKICNASTSRVHGLILLLSDRLQLSRSSISADQSVYIKAFEAISTIFDTCSQVMCSSRIESGSALSTKQVRLYSVDCRGHPFAYFEDDGEYRLCGPAFDTKIWLTLKEAAGFLVKVCSYRLSTGSFLLDLGMVTGVRQNFMSTICRLRHKGAVSLLAEGIETLLSRECAKNAASILPPLVREFVGANEQSLIPRRDCGPAAVFNVIFRSATSGPFKQVSALCLVREISAKLMFSVEAHATELHKPTPSTLHLVYCLLKAVDNIGDSSDDRLALFEIYRCVVQVSLSLGSWNIINASMLVLAAIVKKVTSSKPSFRGFRHAYPQMCEFATNTLAELQPFSVGKRRVNPSGRKNVIFVCLLLFASLLRPQHDGRVGSDDIEFRQQLHATLFAFSTSDDAVCRRLAAEAASKLDFRLSSPTAVRGLLSALSDSETYNSSDGVLQRLRLAVMHVESFHEKTPSTPTSDLLRLVYQTMIGALVACKLPPFALANCVVIIRHLHMHQPEGDGSTASSVAAIMRRLLTFFAPQRTVGSTSICKELIETLSAKSFACSEHIPFMIGLLLSKPCAPNVAIPVLRSLATAESVRHLQTKFKRQFATFLQCFNGSDNSRLVDSWAHLFLGLDSLDSTDVMLFLEKHRRRLMTTRTPSCVRLFARLVSDALSNASESMFSLADWVHIACQCAKSDAAFDMKSAVLSGAQLVFAKSCMPVTTGDIGLEEMFRFVFNILVPLIYDNNSTVRNLAQSVAFSAIDAVSGNCSVTPGAVSLLLISALCSSYAHSDVFWLRVHQQLQLSVDSVSLAAITDESEPFKTENDSEFFSDFVVGRLIFQALQQSKCLHDYGAKGGSHYRKLLALGQALTE